jgi:GNAT superfamily N-acetyltransferase
MGKVICLKDANREIVGQAVELLFRNFPRLDSICEMYHGSNIPTERLFAYIVDKDVLGSLKRGYDSDWEVVSVNTLAIREDFRGQGIGTKLLAGFEQSLIETGIKKVGVQPRVKENVINFYQKNGYHLVRDYCPMWMEKNLA